MELRAFAERVLFATSLEDKLLAPADITDENPGSPIAAPPAPGRAAGLRFKLARSHATADFPGLHRLEQEQERGRLLHFFANHELLATELMALVLLRFPDAPSDFRRGVLQTLRDEQRHTAWYVARMKQCGIQFGDLPVSGYFWRAISGMENPMDYVAGLSLTFEQANLDFCRHFAHGFSRVGDTPTAKLLDRIYHDEIGHVAYGLKWFRRWKDPKLSDWDAFCRQLRFPLSPQRAKGFSLNVEGRRAAGLEAAFIAELDVFSQSKGRTPSVFLFNPFAEGYLARGQAFTPVKHQVLLAADLANLPQFLCRQDDLVLTSNRPSVEFLSSIKQAGFALPEFVQLPVGPRCRGGEVPNLPPIPRDRKLGSLRPWAWGPDSLEVLAPLFPQVTGEPDCKPEKRFNPKIAALYSKAWSAGFLKRFLDRPSQFPADRPAATWADEPWLCTLHEVGVVVKNVPDALAVIARIRARGHHKVVAKQALGLAGHNALRLWEPELTAAQRRWLEQSLEQGIEIVVEPWLEREVDFSIQLEMGAEGLKLRGFTGLINDLRGQFQANWAAPNFARGVPAPVLERFPAPADAPRRLQCLCQDLLRALDDELRSSGYRGPVGVDAFVYRDAQGRSRLKPVVEVNPRYTMGRLTLELMQRTCPGSHGLFRLVNLSQMRAEGFADFPAYAAARRAQAPLVLEGEPVPRIRSGLVCLNDPAHAQVCLATFCVSTKPINLRAWNSYE
jgi:uncharacterized ferritin-like protein (DUF455 family)